MTNSIGKRLMPIYLVKFLLSIYDGPEIPNFGARMVSRSFIAFVDSLYKLFGGQAPTDYGRRLVPEYLIKWIEDADYIEFIDDDIAYIKDVPEKALKFAFINKVGGMCYKVEDSLGNFEIEETKVTSVISKDSSDNTLGTLNIPAEVQALEGYGLGIKDDLYNYVDFENKKFIKIISKIKFSDIDPSQIAVANPGTSNERVILSLSYLNIKNADPTKIPNIITEKFTSVLWNNVYYHITNNSISQNGYSVGIYADYLIGKTKNEIIELLKDTTIYFELKENEITDISQYLGDNMIEVKPEGTLTFENTNNNLAPSEVAYIVPNGE